MKRILFVDDESNVLEGLRRMLRPQRRQWEMHFAHSAEEALHALEQAPFHVVVTDMRMPGMDGAALLREVQIRSPHTVRIALTGHADTEATLRGVAISHQFLSKPCDPDLLKQVVDRACALESILSDDRLKTVMGGIVRLPVAPRTYSALTLTLADARATADHVSAVVEQDLMVSAKVLQVVNSSSFVGSGQVSSIRQAVTCLGTDVIRALVLTFEVFQQFMYDTRSVGGFSIEAEQDHALLTANIARRLLVNERDADQAYLTGLLHDIGQLVMASHMRESLAAVLREAQCSREPLYLAEERVIGVSHAELGAYLLGLWGMPYPIVEAITHHHRPSRAPARTELGVLGATHVADFLAREQRRTDLAEPSLDRAYLTRLGVIERLQEWRDLAAEESDKARAA